METLQTKLVEKNGRRHLRRSASPCAPRPRQAARQLRLAPADGARQWKQRVSWHRRAGSTSWRRRRRQGGEAPIRHRLRRRQRRRQVHVPLESRVLPQDERLHPDAVRVDTFRAGAVEQLRVHAQSLELPLFEKGYGKDAAGIATDGIRTRSRWDTTSMVDTAGRMQDNEPLMRSLKLVTLNNPDLVSLWEALGNEAVDQVTGFNTSPSTPPRRAAPHRRHHAHQVRHDRRQGGGGAQPGVHDGQADVFGASADVHGHPQPERRPLRPRAAQAVIRRADARR